MNNKPYGMWISPSGDCWDVPDFGGHEDIARQITGELFSKSDSLMPESRYLLASGFCRVIYENNHISIEIYQDLKKYQKEILKCENEDFTQEIRVDKKEISFLDFVCHAHFKYNFVPLYPWK